MTCPHPDKFSVMHFTFFTGAFINLKGFSPQENFVNFMEDKPLNQAIRSIVCIKKDKI